MKDKISLAGDLGSGKSTVSRILIDALGAEYYSTGSIVRSIAERMGMTVVELNQYMETHPEIDNEIDDGLVRLGEVDKPLIIDSRMAWHFTPDTFKVYLSTDIETSAIRIMNANRKGEHALTLEGTIADTRARRQSEQKRYFEQYGVDIKDLLNYSLVVDTTYANPDEIADLIITAFGEWKENGDKKICYISPERLNFSEDGFDQEGMLNCTAMIERGETPPPVTAFEIEGEFYVEGGIETAMAYAFSMHTFVPLTLVKGEIGDRKYVKMSNSL